MSTYTQNIIINLSESRNAKKFASQNLIHGAEFLKVSEWIDDRLEYIDSLNRKKTPKDDLRLHETITILGSRGSGKTSFLLSVLDHCKSLELEVIPIIDPTLIEEKGHIFLTILSEINNRVTQALLTKELHPESEYYMKKAEWDKRLKSLAKGLPSIDIINNGYQDWQDPEYVMNKGLQEVYAARMLEHNFHKLLEFGLNILDKKAFVIALDDIDIDFRKGWPVLETIRKYMTSPYIITLLSGDARLFSKAIRKQQWKNFGKSLLKNEGEVLGQMRRFNDMVTEMELQYFLKVIQPRRRVYLTTVKEKIDSAGGNTGLYINSPLSDSRIDRYYNRILQYMGIKNAYQAEAYRSLLLGLPIRTQIQFLSIFERADLQQPAADLTGINNDIIETFLSDLYEKNIDADILKMNDNYLIPFMLQLLIDEKILGEAYQLQPLTTDQGLNITLMVLSFMFSQKTIGNPYMIFDYFIRIGYVRNVFSVLGYRTDEKNTSTPSIEHMCRFTGLGRDSGLRDMSCMISAYLLAARKEPGRINGGDKYLGMIHLPGMERTLNRKKQQVAWRIDEVFKDADTTVKDIAFLPLSISQNNRSNGSRLTYSIYTLLAAIGELIRKCRIGSDESLSTLSQLRSYPMPSFDYGAALDTNDIEAPDTDSRGSDNDILASFRQWAERYPEGYMVSPHLLGKISTRLFYALKSIENRKEQTALAETVHSMIVIFMNSVLIEEAKEVAPQSVSELNVNNPNLSDKIFIDNLNKVTRREDIWPLLKLTKWICSCPLLVVFLKKTDDENSARFLASYFADIHDSTVNGIDVYDKLFEVKYAIVEHEEKWDLLVELLKSFQVPYNLFAKTENRNMTNKNNKEIKLRTKALGIKEEYGDNWLGSFKKYIYKNGIEW